MVPWQAEREKAARAIVIVLGQRTPKVYALRRGAPRPPREARARAYSSRMSCACSITSWKRS